MQKTSISNKPGLLNSLPVARLLELLPEIQVHHDTEVRHQAHVATLLLIGQVSNSHADTAFRHQAHVLQYPPAGILLYTCVVLQNLLIQN